MIDSHEQAHALLFNLFMSCDFEGIEVSCPAKEVPSDTPFVRYEPGDTITATVRFRRRKAADDDGRQD